jgi:hypothetical protein
MKEQSRKTLDGEEDPGERRGSVRSQVHEDTYEPLKGEDGAPIQDSEASPADW